MDLTTRYLGLTLKSPLVAGASPLTGEVSNIRHLEDLGAGAIVLPSIFEEQIEKEEQLIECMELIGAESYAEALTYFPPASSYRLGPQRYLEVLHRATAAVDIPIIGSLNGTTDQGWVKYAREIENAGADALELNIYLIPANINTPGSQIEQRYIAILKAIKQAVAIPVSVKLSPYFSSMGHLVTQLVDAGADGLVLFNRFYQPDIDLGQLALLSNLDLSSRTEIRLPLLWIGVLSGQFQASLAASTGVESADEVVKYLLAGADVVMTTSALLRNGVGYMKELLDGLKNWVAARDLNTLDPLRGCLSQKSITDPTAFARANYIRILQDYQADRSGSHSKLLSTQGRLELGLKFRI
jgi:dihydroorotate dehydrogenase (fumarate)